MIIEVVSIEENQDGSALVVFDMDQEAKECFIRIGIIKSLMDGLNSAKELNTEKSDEG
jgi:hypothetical protein